MFILYAYKLFLKFLSEYIHPNYFFYCFECCHRVCPNLSSAPCIACGRNKKGPQWLASPWPCWYSSLEGVVSFSCSHQVTGYSLSASLYSGLWPIRSWLGHWKNYCFQPEEGGRELRCHQQIHETDVGQTPPSCTHILHEHYFNSISPDLWRRCHSLARTRFWHCWWLFFSWSKIFSFPFIKHAFFYNTVFNGFFEDKSNVVKLGSRSVEILSLEALWRFTHERT